MCQPGLFGSPVIVTVFLTPWLFPMRTPDRICIQIDNPAQARVAALAALPKAGERQNPSANGKALGDVRIDPTRSKLLANRAVY
ncbi:MAG: hypothetical protein A3G25_21575 [Betaproteobacteria bacterium RIFCSPLOWO2_12_FULL_63_13]|nr:MAG: hypothetical protein A3G25_21575 [Betaproteobacteria bacterium RIFCSPLOWO2_12_FULL_63_13]